MKTTNVILACSLLANAALLVYALRLSRESSTAPHTELVATSKSVHETNSSALDREPRADDSSALSPSVNPSSRDKQVVTLPRSALRYLHFEGISDKDLLTQTFDDVASVTKTEHDQLQKIADKMLVRLRQERDASSRIRSESSSGAVIDVLPYASAISSILAEAADQARRVADPEAAEIFATVLHKEAEQRFNSAGERAGIYEVVPFTGRDGGRYYRVTVSENSPGSAQTAAHFINEYSREQFLRQVPLAAQLSSIQ